jgi:acyl-coenzyme A thioesterase PaaI-like protein
LTADGEENADLIADGWRPVRPGAFINLIGPFYTRLIEGRPQFCFRVAPKHDNTQGRPHGGMIMSFLDEALGWTAHMARPDERFFTVGFDCQFIGGSMVGDLVVAEAEVVNATKSLIFMRGDLKVGGRIIASASGIWKVLTPRG